MGCPCANPPGKGAGRPVPRHPMTLKPMQSNTLSRESIRKLATRREPARVAKGEGDDLTPAPRPTRPGYLRPLTGFLGDALRNNARRR